MTGPTFRVPGDSTATGPAVVQTAVARAREEVLGGRGSSASQEEVDRNTRDRPWLAGQPMPQHLAALAHQTAVARGDASAVAADIAEANDRLAATVAAIRQQVSPSRIPGALTRTVDAHPWTTGAALGAGLSLVVGRRRR